MADFIIGAFISALCTFIIGGILSIFYLPMLCTEDGFWYAIVGTILIITVLVLLLRKNWVGGFPTNFFYLYYFWNKVISEIWVAKYGKSLSASFQSITNGLSK